MNMEVKWKYASDGDACYLDIPIENQTLHIAMEMSNWNMDTVWFNVYMTLYNKRSHINTNESNIKMTGANPLKTIVIARKAFKRLEQEVLLSFNRKYNVVIHCSWLDNRRRDAYYRVLSKWGYRYGKDPYDGTKWIFRKWKKGECYEAVD